MYTQLRKLLPGLVVLGAIGVLSRAISEFAVDVNYLILAIAIGVLVGNTIGVPSWAEAGVGTHKLWLEAGIVMMGARLVLWKLVDAGPMLLVLVPTFVIISLTFMELLSRNFFGLSEKLSTLLATGMSICGVSAIIAVAGGIKAREEDIAYAVATILLFDALTLFSYPLVGAYLGLPDRVFGIWAGLSMFSTGPVTAAGFIYSEAAGQWATVTKLARNVFIGFVAIGYSLWYARRDADARSIDHKITYIWNRFPKFVVGFVIVMLVANLGLLGSGQIASMKHGYKWAFMVAFAGLGLNIKLTAMRKTGLKPIMTVLLGLIGVSLLSLIVVSTIF